VKERIDLKKELRVKDQLIVEYQNLKHKGGVKVDVKRK